MSTPEADYLARLEALTARLERDAADSRRDLAQALDRRADAARSGELGRDWQTIQRRVDAGRTSVAAIFSGQDDSPEAVRLLDLSRRQIARLGEDLPADLEEERSAVLAEQARIGRGPVVLRAVDDPRGTRDTEDPEA